MNVQELRAGRDLDLVMAGALGWTDIRSCVNGTYGTHPSREGRVKVPRYSTSIEAAWRVIEWLRFQHDRFVDLHNDQAGWTCEIGPWSKGSGFIEECAVTASLAICRAALAYLAKGVT